MNTATKEKAKTGTATPEFKDPAAQPLVVAPPAKRKKLVEKFADRFSIDPDKLLDILRATAFKTKEGDPPVTNEQMAALLVVAEQYGLNPFTKEIYAYPDKQNGIVPVVSVDGWNRIVQQHPQFNGFEFNYSDAMIEPGDTRCPGLKYKAHEWIEAVFYRKAIERPVVIREYFEEVYRPPFVGKGRDGQSYTKEGPWQSHDKRMHRHKTFIQGGRMAFGFAGIYDDDEAQRILEREVEGTHTFVEPIPAKQAQSNAQTDGAKEALRRSQGKDRPADAGGDQSIGHEAPAPTEAKKADPVVMTKAEVEKQINAATDLDALSVAASVISAVESGAERGELAKLYAIKKAALEEEGE